MTARVAIAAAFLVAITVTGDCSWPDKHYAEVRAYAYNQRGDIGRSIITKGRLDGSILNKTGVVLTREQTARLVVAVTGKHPLPEEFAACFNPRHAFVFYDAAREPIASVELCFECDNARAEPSRVGHVYDVGALKRLATELRLPLLPK